MDTEDFPTSPAKRQRTTSPEETRPSVQVSDSLSADLTRNLDNKPLESHQEPVAVVQPEENKQQDATPKEPPSNSLLDALMLQVEAESSPNPPSTVDESVPISSAVLAEKDLKQGGDGTPVNSDGLVTTHEELAANGVSDAAGRMELADTTAPTNQNSLTDIAMDIDATTLATGNATDVLPVAEPIGMDAIPTNNALVPEEDVDGAEWEIDSSPYESSDSDSSSSDDSSEEDSEDDADGDYAMLDPEETARILMQGDGGSDDEGDGSKRKPGGLLRTANERMEEVIPKPDILVTDDMKIEELGNVELVVESTVVIKAKTSGEYRVLESGSLICLKHRAVVGVVADLIGRVEEPRYTIRFTNDDDIREAGLWESGTTVYYVPDHSTFVFTLPLKAVKGSDASNFHDEEVGDEEMEFSDDEAEAEHKRQMKAKRQGRTLESTGRGGRGGSKFARGSHRGGGRGRGGGQFASHISNNADGSAYGSGSLEMNYDDVSMPDTNEDGYTPLQRPADLTEMVTKGEQPQERGMPHPLPPPPPPSHFNGGGDYSGRGRGRGQNRGGRGAFRPNRGRGGLNQPHDNHLNQHNTSNSYPNGFSQRSQHNSYAHQSNSTLPPTPNISVPNTPSITPHNVSYPPMTPSPITPLPNVSSFNFGRGFQPPSSFLPFPPPPPTIPGLPPPPPFPQSFNYPQPQPQPQPQQQYQQHQTSHHQPHQSYASNSTNTSEGQANYLSGAWANNPAVAAALLRQIEEQRRASGQ